MLNHKTIFKQKSKILLTIICIFGLAFSYSCSCRSGGDPTRVNGGTASGNWTMQLTSDGKGYKQEATISFEKATATLKSVTDVDSGITIEDGDFVYEGNTLKLKKDTTDPSEIDATTAAKITWDGTTVKKVKATFTLTPSASDVDLDATEKEVVISIKKVKVIENSYIFETLKNSTGYYASLEGKINADANTLAYELSKAKNSSGAIEMPFTADMTDNFSKTTMKRRVIYQFDLLFKTTAEARVEAAEDTPPTSTGGTDISFKIKFTFNDNFDSSKMTNPIEVILKGSANITWTD